MTDMNRTDSERLIKIETLVGVVIKKMDSSHDDHEDRIRTLELLKDDVRKVRGLESRVRNLEKSFWLITGAAATGGGFIGGILPNLIGLTP